MFSKNPAVFLARRAWQFAGRWRGFIAVYLVLFLLATVVSLAEPVVIGRLLNALQLESTRERLLAQVKLFALGYFVIQLAFWLFHGPARVMERWVSFHVRAAYKTHLFRAGTELPLAWHRDHPSGESIDKIDRAASALYEFTGSSFELLYMVFRFAGSQLCLMWVLPSAGLAAMATTAAVLVMVYRMDRKLTGQYDALNSNDNHVAAAVHDYFTNMVTVITLRLQAPVLSELVRRLFAALATFRSNIIVNELKWFSTNMLIGLMVAAVVWGYAAQTMASGQVLLGGTVLMLFEYLRRVGDSFYNFTAIYGTLVRQAADVRGAETLESAHAARDPGMVPAPAPAGWKTLAVRGLDFTYQDDRARTHHLKDVGLELERGRSIALVGASGSGKSTLMTLLRGLSAPERVEVLADGVPLPHGLRHLAGCTTLMPQDPEIFADTIGFNITFGLEASDEDVRRALKLARFDPVLERLPKGLATSIAEKGVNLSGGEKQRLALARGIFFARDSDVVLLDEPTSSVDTLNERLIYGALLAHWRDRCVVSSIHRLHLLPLFDRVVVLEDGRVVEAGTAEQLMRRGGLLARMHASYAASPGALEAAG